LSDYGAEYSDYQLALNILASAPLVLPVCPSGAG
jgi:hypothetical protein